MDTSLAWTVLYSPSLNRLKAPGGMALSPFDICSESGERVSMDRANKLPDDATLSDLYLNQRLTMQAIGEHYGVTRQRVQQRLVRIGIRDVPRKTHARSGCSEYFDRGGKAPTQ